MKNIELNMGGLVGAAILGGIAGLLFYGLGVSVKNPAKALVFAIIAGAVAGTFIWGKLFPKKQNNE
jgi:hypothetical protein